MAQNPPCTICGEGLTLTNPQGIVNLGSNGTPPCAQLEAIGLQGGIPEQSCLPIQQLSQEPCGCEVLTGAPTSTPAPTALATEAPTFQPTFTPAPTSNPTGTPTFPPAPECWDDLDAIFAREISLSPELVLAEPRTYVLCSNTNYFMGNDPGRNFQFQTGFASLIGRPNVHYKCGDSGSSANNCRLLSGSYPIALLDPFDTVNTNVTFQGLTIESSFEFGMLVSKPGDVLLLDCIFRNHENIAPILLQNSLSQTFTLTVRHCIFEGNRKNLQGQPGIIVALSEQNAVVLEDVIFRNNDYSATSTTMAVLVQGAPLTIKDTCFENNFFTDVALVLTVGSPVVEATNNFVSDPDSSLRCPFWAPLTGQGRLQPCIDAEAIACSFEAAPTRAPSPTPPVAEPTRIPVPRVTRAPTSEPTLQSSTVQRFQFGMALGVLMGTLSLLAV